MDSPAIVVVDSDSAALDTLERALRSRYTSDYTIACLGSAEEAVATLERMESEGAPAALVLVAHGLVGTTGGGVLERVRQLHPHAKAGWSRSRAAIRRPPRRSSTPSPWAASTLRPEAGPPDEVFHQAISSFLLEWATERAAVPHTVHVVGELVRPGLRAAEVFERCAMPHTFCLADSDEGRELLARAGAGRETPDDGLPGRRALSDPSNAEIAGRRARRSTSSEARLRPGDRRGGTGRAVGRGLRRLRGAEHAGRRRGRHRRPGRDELDDPQLPGVPAGRQRRRAGLSGLRAGLLFGAEFVFTHRVDGTAARGDRQVRRCRWPTAARARPGGDPRHRR